CPSAPVADAVRTCGVPRHTNEQRAIVAIVGGPPFLRVRHQGTEVLDHGIQVEALEFLCVVKILVHGIGHGRVLAQDSQIEPVRPPLRIGRARKAAAVYWALAFACHSLILICHLPFLLLLVLGTSLDYLSFRLTLTFLLAGRALASRHAGSLCREPRFPPNSATARTDPGSPYLRAACPPRGSQRRVLVGIGRKGRDGAARRCRRSAQHRAGGSPLA